MSIYKKEQFKNINGKQLASALFFELTLPGERDHTLFTLASEDKHGYKSLYQLYFEYCVDDPSEFTFAQEVFTEWSIWEAVSNSPRIKPYIDKWRDELDIRIKSIALSAIIKTMESDGRSSYSAAKLLLEKGYIDKETAEEKKRNRQFRKEQERKAMDLVDQDRERLGLKRMSIN